MIFKGKLFSSQQKRFEEVAAEVGMSPMKLNAYVNLHGLETARRVLLGQPTKEEA